MPTPERMQKIESVIARRQSGFAVVFEDLHDAHNITAIMRTCDAFGVQDVRAIYEKQKKVNLRRVGKVSSSSANKWLSLQYFDSTKECLSKLKDEGYYMYGTILDDQTEGMYDIDFTQKDKVAIVVGNEHAGISEVASNMVDQKMYIPMRGFVESLNVSVATALCIAEVSRQRRVCDKDFSLSSVDRQNLFDVLS